MKKDVSNLKKRLNNVAGQINGISKMIDEGKECLDIITQLKAAKAGLAKASAIIIQNHLTECLNQKDRLTNKAEIEKLVLELSR